MLKTHQKWRLTDENKESEFFIEVNWDEKDTKTNECKLLRFTFPDGKTATVTKDHFISVIFTMGTQEEQMNMIPYEQVKMRWLETTLGIKATKDIQKGEMINVPVKLSIPVSRDEGIGRLPNQKLIN